LLTVILAHGKLAIIEDATFECGVYYILFFKSLVLAIEALLKQLENSILLVLNAQL